MDVAAVERAEKALDSLIEQRSRTAEPFEALEGASTQAKRVRMVARWRWVRHHRHLAELHLRLSEEHRRKASELEPTEGGDEA